MAPPPPTQPSAGSNMAGAIQTVARVEDPQYSAPHGQMYTIQPGKPSNREQKLRTRQVNLAAMAPPAIPEFLKGSETPISFSKEDHPPSRRVHHEVYGEGWVGEEGREEGIGRRVWRG